MSRRNVALAWIAATIPFAPAFRAFLARGVPDILFTGDGAALELGTFHAVHGVQLVGPYSRFGWSHPGPAYFYLAAPFYEVLGERGPALNVFALTVDYVSALGIVMLAYRVRGLAFSMLVAALVGIYVLIGAPFLLANEWNPIVPILPLALAAFMVLSISTGDKWLWPAFGFLASAVVQTHVGFAPAIVALALFAALRGKSAAAFPVRRRVWMVTALVVALCWLLPFAETLMHPPGNLALIARFFVPRHWSEHTWKEAAQVVSQQLAVMPNGIFQALRARSVTAPRLDLIMLAIQVVVLAWMASSATWTVPRSFARIALLEIAVAFFAVRAIRGNVEFYLVAWISAVGITSFAAFAAGALDVVERFSSETAAQTVASSVSIVLVLLSLTLPVARSPVVRAPDEAAETLSRQVDTYVKGAHIGRPIIRVRSMSMWPTAAAALLYLEKRGVAAYAAGGLLDIVGNGYAPDEGSHIELIVDSPDSLPPVSAVPIARSREAVVYRLD